MDAVVVGLGWAARSIWLPALLARDVRVAGVDPDPSRREAAERDFPGVAVAGGLDDALDGATEFGVVATPNYLHSALAAAFLERGIPVVVEKPVCLTRDEAERLASLEGPGSVVIPSAPARFRADVRQLHRLVESGRLGDPRLLELEWVRSSGIPARGSWFTSARLAGGGAMIDLGWHLLDLAFALVGFQEVDHASCVLGYDFIGGDGADADWRGGDGSETAEPDVEDSAATWMVTRSGQAIQMRAAWASWEPWDVTRVAVHGSGGAATLRTTFGSSPHRVRKPVLTVRTGRRMESVDPEPGEVGAEYEAMVADVVARVRQGSLRSRMREIRVLVSAVERLYADGMRRRAGRPG